MNAPDSSSSRLVHRRAAGIRPSFLQPALHIRVAHQPEDPPEQRETVAVPKPETSRVRREGIHERARMVEGATDSIADDMGHGLWILPVAEEVRCDPRRASNRQATQHGVLARRDGALVKTDVGTPGLPPPRQRELVYVGGKVF